MKTIFSSRRNKIPHNNEGIEKIETPFFSKESKKPFFNAVSGNAVQTKLTVGEPGDKYEKEADSMADAVVNNASKPDVQHKEISNIQRESLATPLEDEKLGTAEQRMEEDKLVQEKPEIQKMDAPEEEMVSKMEGEEEEMVSKMEGEEQEEMIHKMDAGSMEEEETLQAKGESGKQTTSTGLSNQIKNKAGSGKKMSANTQAEMENSFGKDFSEVNIHTDQDAVAMNKTLGAQAFTHGKDVFFNTGKYNPETNEGKHLLAHELTHVIQQSDRKEIQKKSENTTGSKANAAKTTNKVKNFVNNTDFISMQTALPGTLPAPAIRIPWRFFWRAVIKRFAIRGAVAAGLAAIDGPLPIGDLIALGLAVWIIYDIIVLWSELWEAAKRISLKECIEIYVDCTDYTPHKPCADCLHYCRANGSWPTFRC